MSEYNKRQYSRMMECIESFESKKQTLQKCINDLKALIACLESPDIEIKNTLQANWAVLEEVYAVSLDQGPPHIPSEHQVLIGQTLQKMKEILIKQISND